MPLCDKNTNISWKKPPIGFVSLENANTSFNRIRSIRMNKNGPHTGLGNIHLKIEFSGEKKCKSNLNKVYMHIKSE